MKQVLINCLFYTFDQSIFIVDPTLKISETTQSQICRHPILTEFMDTHCHARAYSFQVGMLIGPDGPKRSRDLPIVEKCNRKTPISNLT